MLRSFVVLVGALVSLTAFSLSAQEVVLGQLYGNGVHAYFAGDYSKAFDQFSAAVTGGSRDPRVYYFRGLAYMKLGREPEAVQDFKKGAELESKDMHRSYNVARALERVQGSARQQLETYRVDARLAALEEAEKIRKIRFEAIKREEERVLRTQAAPGSAAPQAGSEEPAKAEKTDPFGNPADTAKVAEGVTSDTPEKPEASEEGSEKSPEKPEAMNDMSAEKSAEKPETAGDNGEEKPALQAEPPADKSAEKPAVAEKKSGAPKKGILGALLKGAESGIKKSIGGVGNMLPMGGGPGGMPMPPGGMPVPPGGMPMPPGGTPMPPGGTPMPPGGNPFKEENTPAEMGTPEKQAPEKAAPEKPAEDSSADPFSS